jgi:dTDP-4-dehydrorhamnose 3,5-epimerase
MRITDTSVTGVFVVEPDVIRDDRGTIVPVWLGDSLGRHGLVSTLAQCNLVRNHRRGTLRGLHYQRPPLQEVKLVGAVRGRIFDVAVDLRPESPTFRHWTALEIDAEAPRMLYLPAGCAHGYQTLTDDAEVMYFVSAPYSAAHQQGVRWDDPAFGIQWPLAPTVIHPRDASYPDFPRPAASGASRPQAR